MSRLIQLVMAFAFVELAAVTLWIPGMAGSPAQPFPWVDACTSPVSEWAPVWHFDDDGLEYWVPVLPLDPRASAPGPGNQSLERVVLRRRIHRPAWLAQIIVVLALNGLIALALKRLRQTVAIASFAQN